jgi:signal transduction histidine kinase
LGLLPLDRALLGGEDVRGEQLLVRQVGTGHDIPVLINCSPVRGSTDEILGASAIFQDISTFRELDRLREEFLAAVSHDLKNPLSSIIGVTQLLQRTVARLDNPDSDRFQEGLATVMRAARRMSAQVNELLDIALITAKQDLPLEIGQYDLVAVVANLIEEHRLATEKHTFVLQSSQTKLLAQGDAPRLTRAISNILSNAEQYSPGGGAIVVTVSAHTEGSDCNAVITIADEGVGIEAPELPRVFAPFYRSGATVHLAKGTGIGLASARHIVEQHGGAITIASEPGHGTVVSIWLPLECPA